MKKKTIGTSEIIKICNEMKQKIKEIKITKKL